MSVLKEINELQKSVAQEIIGQEEIVEKMIISILANGNLLVESLPGLAKTRSINALSKNIECSFGRIQFTPDLATSDIVGKTIMEEDESGNEMSKFIPGPIFNNIVLADEINRSPPKTQNALLEAMEERQVTVNNVVRKVPDLFMVMATMNPATQQGTYPLLEAQVDRFLMHLTVDYPDEEAEAGIVELIRKETDQENKNKDIHKEKRKLMKQDVIFAARKEIDQVEVPGNIQRYMVDLIFATRYPQRYTYELRSFIAFGASPRASIALDRVVRTHAWLRGQKAVEPENIQAMLSAVLRHRLIRGDRAIEHRITTDDICQEIIDLVPIPGQGEQAKSKKEA